MNPQEQDQDDVPRLRKYRIKGEDVYRESIGLQDAQFLNKQYKRIYNYKPKSEIWPLLYGSTILAGTAGLTGAYLMTCYRRNFRIFHHSGLVTYAPTVVCPAFISYLFHEFLIMKDIMIPGVISCPSCVSVRSGVLQSLFGAVWPLALSPLACVLVALKHYTIPIDQTTPIHRTILPLLKNTSPKSGILLSAIIGNFFIGMWVAGKKGKAYEKFLYMDNEKEVQVPDQTF